MDAKKKEEAAKRRQAADATQIKIAEEARIREEEACHIQAEADKKSFIKKMAVALCLIIALAMVLFNASTSNSSSYFIKVKKSATLIYKGTFSPTGKKLVMKIPSAVALETVKKSYSLDEVKPIIFQQYMANAEALRTSTDAPDLSAVMESYEKSVEFAPSAKEREEAQKQLEVAKAVLESIQ